MTRHRQALRSKVILSAYRSHTPGRTHDGSHATANVARRRPRPAAKPTNGPQIPHERDELYFVAAGTGRYRVEDTVSTVGPGDLLFCAARVAHGFEDISEDFCVWVLFYGSRK
jgi:mannose-6-phosphate isomerase-like protein (cupin superfamily)